jgi:hypothetical protein
MYTYIHTHIYIHFYKSEYIFIIYVYILRFVKLYTVTLEITFRISSGVTVGIYPASLKFSLLFYFWNATFAADLRYRVATYCILLVLISVAHKRKQMLSLSCAVGFDSL